MDLENHEQNRLAGLIADEREILAAIEALLFVANEPVEVAVIAKALDWAVEDIERGIAGLAAALEHNRRGLAIQRNSSYVQLVTAPRFGAVIEHFLAVERTVRFSEAALEALAIIAYRQPITRAEIEAIRGVDCSGVLATLVAREMIEVVGRRTTVGNPLLYGTTHAFLRHFGISAISDLPGGDQD